MLYDLDLLLFHALYGGDSARGLTMVMIVFSLIGSGWTMLGLIPLLWVRRTRVLAIWITALLVGTAALVAMLKHAVGRLRPCVAIDGVIALWGAPSDYSFPSGHAAGSFTFAVFFATLAASLPWGRVFTGASAVAIMLAVGVALSRVYLGVHFPADVIGGAILGSALGVIGGRGYLAHAVCPLKK